MYAQIYINSEKSDLIPINAETGEVLDALYGIISEQGRKVSERIENTIREEAETKGIEGGNKIGGNIKGVKYSIHFLSK